VEKWQDKNRRKNKIEAPMALMVGVIFQKQSIWKTKMNYLKRNRELLVPRKQKLPLAARKQGTKDPKI
jgi:hypothetical protein